jgi:hypothetical protein
LWILRHSWNARKTNDVHRHAIIRRPLKTLLISVVKNGQESLEMLLSTDSAQFDIPFGLGMMYVYPESHHL